MKFLLFYRELLKIMVRKVFEQAGMLKNGEISTATLQKISLGDMEDASGGVISEHGFPRFLQVR